MAAITGVSLTTPRFLTGATETPKLSTKASSSSSSWLNQPWKSSYRTRGANRMHVLKPVAAAPDSLSEKVAESIKEAQEACAGDPVSGECVAAWDEVEELSAAASHAKARAKDTDPLETYCKDNPADDECRTYED